MSPFQRLCRYVEQKTGNRQLLTNFFIDSYSGKILGILARAHITRVPDYTTPVPPRFPGRRESCASGDSESSQQALWLRLLGPEAEASVRRGKTGNLKSHKSRSSRRSGEMPCRPSTHGNLLLQTDYHLSHHSCFCSCLCAFHTGGYSYPRTKLKSRHPEPRRRRRDSPAPESWRGTLSLSQAQGPSSLTRALMRALAR